MNANQALNRRLHQRLGVAMAQANAVRQSIEGLASAGRCPHCGAARPDAILEAMTVTLQAELWAGADLNTVSLTDLGFTTAQIREHYADALTQARANIRAQQGEGL